MDYELIPDETLKEFIQELKELKESIRELKSLPNEENKKKDISKDIKNIKKTEEPPVKVVLHQSNEIYKELTESLIRSNLELQAKLSELIVLNTEVMKGIKELLNIFKEAAIRSMYEKKPKELRTEEKVMEKLESLEKTNVKFLEVVEKLNEKLDKLEKKDENKDILSIKKPLTPPPLPPQPTQLIRK